MPSQKLENEAQNLLSLFAVKGKISEQHAKDIAELIEQALEDRDELWKERIKDAMKKGPINYGEVGSTKLYWLERGAKAKEEQIIRNLKNEGLKLFNLDQ